MILTWFSTHYNLLYGDNLKMPPYNLQRKYFNGQIRALLHYKHLEEMDLKEIEKKEKDKKNEEDEILSRVGFSELKGMIELNVDGGVEAIQEYHRLLKDDPDDHYFQSLSWPSSEEYRVR